VIADNLDKKKHKIGESEIVQVDNDKYQVKQLFQVKELSKKKDFVLKSNVFDGNKLLTTIKIPVGKEMKGT